MVFYLDINGFFKEPKQKQSQSDWQLFIDSSQVSPKAVLLHEGNAKHSIPIAHAVHVNVTYDNIEKLLDANQYNVHQWNICFYSERN
jgi:hypothetical protein